MESTLFIQIKSAGKKMDDTALRYFRDELNELRKVQEETSRQVAINEQKLWYVEDNSKGSLSTREERASTISIIKERLEAFEKRITALELADRNLGERFFKVWSGIFSSLVIMMITFFWSQK